jgi:hypothetical protein
LKSRPIRLPSGLTVEEVLVTPELAKTWVELNHPDNRHWRQGRSAKYAADMSQNRWEEATHQGIAFDEEGYLVDGRHRLEAVIMSGKSVRMLVFHGLSLKAMAATDRHLARSVADGATIAGRPMTNEVVAVARRMYYRHHAGTGGVKESSARKLTDMALMDFTAKHAEALAFAMSMPLSGLPRGHTTVRAVMARSYYSADVKRVKEFASALASGFYQSRTADGAAVLLRQYLSRQTHGAKQSPTIEVYRKVERALSHFLAGETPEGGRLFEARKELFPLPEEQEEAQ